MEDKPKFLTQNSVALSIILLFAGQLSTFLIGYYKDERHHEETKLENQRVKLKESLTRENEALNEVATALTNLRVTRSLIREKCKYYPQDIASGRALYEANRQRIEAQGRLILTSEKVHVVFGSELGFKIGEMIHKYDDWDSGMDNVCKQDESLGKEYFSRELAILEPMRMVIRSNEIRLKEFDSQ